MSARTKARKRALDILYSADVRGQELAAAVAEAARRAEAEPQRASSWEYARRLAEGVTEHLSEIDEAIAEHSVQWSLERMPALDRAILRLGTWELRYNADEIPRSVAIAEAVAAAREYSTDSSARFVNGVLAALSTPDT